MENCFKIKYWVLNEFNKFNYIPKNCFEASYFLKDAILEIGKDKEYSIEFKDGELIRTFVLNKDNSQFAFHHEIWEKLNNKQKANCINWYTQKISKMLTNKSIDVSFILLSNEENIIAEFYSKYNKVYIPLDIEPQLILNSIFHELTHMKQKNIKKSIPTNKLLYLNDEEVFLFFSANFEFFKNKKLNDALYWFNPNEVGARNKAFKFQKQVLKEYEKEFKTFSKDLKWFNKIKQYQEINDEMFSLGFKNDPQKAISSMSKIFKNIFEKNCYEILIKKCNLKQYAKKVNECSAEIEFTKQKILNLFDEQAIDNFQKEYENSLK